jgi:hypothetical protein
VCPHRSFIEVINMDVVSVLSWCSSFAVCTGVVAVVLRWEAAANAAPAHDANDEVKS